MVNSNTLSNISMTCLLGSTIEIDSTWKMIIIKNMSIKTIKNISLFLQSQQIQEIIKTLLHVATNSQTDRLCEKLTKLLQM